MLKQETINELGQILREDYGASLGEKELNGVASNLIGYFNLLGKMAQAQKFENHQPRLLEKSVKGVYDEGNESNSGG